MPDFDDVIFHLKIAESFPRWGLRQYFDVDYDSLLLENAILDGPIRRVMLEAKESIQKGDSPTRSKQDVRSIGCFQVHILRLFLRYSSYGSGLREGCQKIDFPNLLANLAFKILLAEDDKALRKLMSITSSLG